MKGILMKVIAPAVMLLGMFFSGGDAVAEDLEKTEADYNKACLCVKEAFDSVTIPYSSQWNPERGITDSYRKDCTLQDDVSVSADLGIEADNEVYLSAFHGDSNASILFVIGNHKIEDRVICMNAPSLDKNAIWALQAVQAMEHKITQCMGVDPSDKRSPTAATSVPEAPLDPVIVKKHQMNQQFGQDIARCAKVAFESVSIPYADRSDMWYHEYTQTWLHPNNDLFDYEDRGSLQISSGASYSSPVNLTSNVSFVVRHDGTAVLPMVDSAKVDLFLTFERAKVTGRSVSISGASVDDLGKGSSPHVKWVLDAAHTMENKFLKCMGIPHSEQRSPDAATSVSNPPPMRVP